MKLASVVLLLISLVGCAGQQDHSQEPLEIDPSEIQFGPYRHAKLPDEFLARIRATTELFGEIDGISYEKAVDLYRRDVDPEKNILIWEEMAFAYKAFCRSRCESIEERRDVYNLLLLRSMVSSDEAVNKAKLSILNREEASQVVGLYRREPEPIEVYQK